MEEDVEEEEEGDEVIVIDVLFMQSKSAFGLIAPESRSIRSKY